MKLFLFNTTSHKGQLFLIFAVVVIAATLPLMLADNSSEIVSLREVVLLHSKEIPRVLNSIVLTYPSEIDFYLRHYHELLRSIFRERAATFSSFTLLGEEEEEFRIYLVNYGTSKNVTVSVNSLEKRISLDEFEITSVTFDLADSYDFSLAFGKVNDSWTARDMSYWTQWIIDRGDEHFEIVKKE